MASAGIECRGKVPVRTFAEKPANQNYDMKPVQLAKTHNAPVVEPKNYHITPAYCMKTCPRHRLNEDTKLLYKRQIQQICTRCNRDKSTCPPVSKHPERCEPYQPIQLVLPPQPMQRQMQNQNQMKSQNQMQPVNQMHPVNQMQPQNQKPSQSQMHTQKGQLKSRNHVQITNYNPNQINPSPSQVCGCDLRSQPQRPVQDIASDLSQRETCDLEHIPNLQDVCEAYQSQIQCKDTIWTVKIMKDAANATRFTNNPVMVQTSMTTIINASKLENLLPMNERFFVDEDDYMQEDAISNAFVDCKPCIMYAEKGIPAIAPPRKQSRTRSKSRSKSRSDTSDKGCCFCCRRKKKRKKKRGESLCMQQQPKDCTDRYIS